MIDRPVDREVGGRLALPVDLGPDAGGVGQQRVLGQAGPVAPHLAQEGRPASAVRVLEAVVDGLDPVQVRAEADPAAGVDGQVQAEPGAVGQGVDQLREGRRPGELEPVALGRVGARRPVAAAPVQPAADLARAQAARIDQAPAGQGGGRAGALGCQREQPVRRHAPRRRRTAV